MRTIFIYVLLLMLMLAQFYGCSKNQALEPTTNPPDQGDDEVTIANVSYNNFVSGLFQTKCASCHAPGGGASTRWQLTDYNSVRSNGNRINNAVLVTGFMPPGGSLSAEEKTLLQAWFDREMPEE